MTFEFLVYLEIKMEIISGTSVDVTYLTTTSCDELCIQVILKCLSIHLLTVSGLGGGSGTRTSSRQYSGEGKSLDGMREPHSRTHSYSMS